MGAKKLSKEELLIKKLKDNGKIVLKARYGKTQGPLVLCPVIDPITREMRGVQNVSEDEKRKLPRVVDENTSRRITDGLELSYSNVIDRVDWEWMVYNKEIASSRKESWKDELSLFFVDDYIEEQKQKVSDRETRLQVQTKIQALSSDRRSEVARLFGVPVNQMDDSEIKEFLYDKAEKLPELVLKRINDQNTKEKLFVMGAIDANIIKLDQDSKIYSYEDLKIGSTLESLIVWVKDEANLELVREIQTSLK